VIDFEQIPGTDAERAMATAWRVEVLMPGGGAVDPFRYGWRYVRRVGDDGQETWEQTPLTLLDVLHPREGDHIVQNAAHDRRCRYLADVLTARLAADPTAVVMHDVGVDWGVEELQPHSPDVSVFLEVRVRPQVGHFSPVEHGGRAALIIEVTSPTTVVLDRATKLGQYERVGVERYVIVDTVADDGEAPPRLMGYQLVAGRFQPQALDERGWLWLEPVELWLGVRDNDIVLYDEAGQPQGDYTALVTALADERATLATERQARVAAEARVRALEDEVRRLRNG
jgi:Uma2 family endonuclease